MQQASDFEADIGTPNVIIFLEVYKQVLISRLNDRGNFDDTKGSKKKPNLHQKIAIM